MTDPLRIWIGFDPREAEAYDVCAHSIRRRASVPVEIEPLRLDVLSAGPRPVFARARDPLQSTEFTYTRFLTPLLADFRGWALYCDCDFLFTSDVDALFAEARARAAVMCVKHEHVAREAVKMDGVAQTNYPRKNWSSLMLFNCDHPSTRRLTAHAVNTASPAWLHQMQWAADAEISALDETWNWLADESPTTHHGIARGRFVRPNAVHYTNGTPIMPGYEACEFAELWLAERETMKAAAAAA